MRNSHTSLQVVEKFYSAIGIAIQTHKLDAVREMCTDDIEWEIIGPDDIPYFGRYTGIDGVTSFFSKLLAAEEILNFAVEDRDCGDKFVTVVGHEKCRARTTQRVFSARWCHLIIVVDGKVAQFREHIDSAIVHSAYKL